MNPSARKAKAKRVSENNSENTNSARHPNQESSSDVSVKRTILCDNGRPPLLAKRKRVSFAAEPASIINPKSNTAHHSNPPPMATKPQPQSQQQQTEPSNYRRRMSISSRKRYMSN